MTTLTPAGSIAPGATPTKHRSKIKRAGLRVGVVIALAAIGSLAACEASPGASPALSAGAVALPSIATDAPVVTPTPEPNATPTPEPTATPTPEPTPTPAPAKVGDTMAFGTSDATLNVRAVAIKVWAGSSYNKPSSGNRWVTIDVLDTGTSGTIDGPPAYTDFTITDLDGRVYQADPAWREPQLPYGMNFDSLKKGQKVRGWVTFELPKTLKAGSVMLTNVDGGEWTFTGLH